MLTTLTLFISSTCTYIIGSATSLGTDLEVESYIRRYKWNQELMQDLVDDYEIVYPFQYRDRTRVGIDTKNYFYPNLTVHFDNCSFIIRSSYGRFRLNVDLNTQLLPAQTTFKYYANETTQFTVKGKNIESCFYQGTVHGESSSSVSLSTCGGLHGAIIIHNETYFIVPLKGGDLGKRHPHMLIKAKWHEKSNCGNTASTDRTVSIKRSLPTFNVRTKRDVQSDMKYLELAVVVDYDTFAYMDLDFKVLTRFIIEAVNGFDLIFKRSFNMRISLSYLEIWMYKAPSFMSLNGDIVKTLLSFIDHCSKHLFNDVKDATLLVTNTNFARHEISMASAGNICNEKSAGVVRLVNRFETFRLSVQMAHNIAHVIGIKHNDEVKSFEQTSCTCKADKTGCLFQGRNVSGKKNRFAVEFSSCSVEELTNVLRRGHGRCLFNKPFQEDPLILCGNKIVDPGEACDCGLPDECEAIDPCCDSVTCSLKSTAECATGDCCENCKLVNYKKLCRQASGVCDIPEYCNGVSGQCPLDATKLDGTICGKQNDGYCFKGLCQTAVDQCKSLWGPDATVAEQECFDKINSPSVKSRASKNESHILCSFLQCRGGYDVPKLPVYSKSEFSERHKAFECKMASNGNKSGSFDEGVVKDGTKCSESKICVKGLCVTVNLTKEFRCPSNHGSFACSGHGVCTTRDWCFCDPGWSGDDCSIFEKVDNSEKAIHGTTLQRSAVEQSNKTVSIDNSLILPSWTLLSLNLDTNTIVTLFGSVAGFVLIVLILLTVCYRRQTTRKRSRRKLNRNRIDNLDENHISDSSVDLAHRSIRFGEMPSYRDEKDRIKRQKRHQKLFAHAKYIDENCSVSDRRTNVVVGSARSKNQLEVSPEAEIFQKCPTNNFIQSPPPSYRLPDDKRYEMLRTNSIDELDHDNNDNDNDDDDNINSTFDVERQRQSNESKPSYRHLKMAAPRNSTGIYGATSVCSVGSKKSAVSSAFRPKMAQVSLLPGQSPLLSCQNRHQNHRHDGYDSEPPYDLTLDVNRANQDDPETSSRDTDNDHVYRDNTIHASFRTAFQRSMRRLTAEAVSSDTHHDHLDATVGFDGMVNGLVTQNLSSDVQSSSDDYGVSSFFNSLKRQINNIDKSDCRYAFSEINNQQTTAADQCLDDVQKMNHSLSKRIADASVLQSDPLHQKRLFNVSDTEPLKLDNIDYLLKRLNQQSKLSNSACSSHDDGDDAVHHSTDACFNVGVQETTDTNPNLPFTVTSPCHMIPTFDPYRSPITLAKNQYSSCRETNNLSLPVVFEKMTIVSDSVASPKINGTSCLPSNVQNVGTKSNVFTPVFTTKIRPNQDGEHLYGNNRSNVCALCKLPTPEQMCHRDLVDLAHVSSSDGSCDNNVCICNSGNVR